MAAQQQPQQGDNSLAYLWIAVAVIVAAGILWYTAHAYIVAAILKVRIFEASIIGIFTNALSSQLAWMQNVNPADVEFSKITAVSTLVGSYLRYAVVPIIVLLAVLIYFRNVTLKFRKIYTMKRLAHEEVVNWPQISPVVDLDLVKEDINEGPWAMAQTPMQFAKKHKLLKEEKVEPTEAVWRKGKPKVVIIREETAKVFTLQMGRHWDGIEGTPVHVQALFAIFASRVAGDSASANKLLDQIARSTRSGKLDFSGTRELLKKHYQQKKVTKVQQEHAFLLTVMASMLIAARQDGVIATADFLWLRPLDRPLWYMLNNMGRQTAFSEVGGPFAHWKAENELGRRIMVPMIEESVNALEEAIESVIYIPDEEEEDDVLKTATG